ncbi:MAG: type II toxin-antitoxin system HigB family toxin [Candidatus Obscuribacterales bacterium]|nr:type II toxin-antitoxin system HigB family toxin [Candidatus Obscuribacterales bacterium]
MDSEFGIADVDDIEDEQESYQTADVHDDWEEEATVASKSLQQYFSGLPELIVESSQRNIVSQENAEKNKPYKDTEGNTVTLDDRGKVVSIIGPTKNITYSYDAAGNWVGMVDKDTVWWLTPDKRWACDKHELTNPLDISYLLYQRILGRPSDPGSAWADNMLKLGYSYQDLVKSLVDQPEFRNSIPKNPEEAIAFLYTRILGRKTPPQPDEIAYWKSVLESKGMDAVLKGIVGSDEFKSSMPKCKVDVNPDDVVKHFRGMPNFREKIDYLLKILETSPEALKLAFEKMDKFECEASIKLLKAQLFHNLKKDWQNDAGSKKDWFSQYPRLFNDPDFIKNGPLPPGVPGYESNPQAVKQYQWKLYNEERNRDGDKQSLEQLLKLAPYMDRKDIEDLFKILMPDEVGRRMKNLPELFAKAEFSEAAKAYIAGRLVDLITSHQLCDYAALNPEWRADAMKMLTRFADKLQQDDIKRLAAFAGVPGFPAPHGKNQSPVDVLNGSGLDAAAVFQVRELCKKLLWDVQGLNRSKEVRDLAFKVICAMPKQVSMDHAVVNQRFGGLDLSHSDNLSEMLKNIERIYGREKFNLITANLDMVNALPPAMRAHLMGWKNLPESEKTALGWSKEPTAEQQQQLNWKGMSETQKENWRWQKCSIDARAVLGLLSSGKFDQSEYAALGKNIEYLLPYVISDMYKQADTSRLSTLKRSRDQVVEKLMKSTEDAAFSAQLCSLFEGYDGIDKGLEGTQKSLINWLHTLEREISKQEASNSEVASMRSMADLAFQAKAYRECLLAGDQANAARVALAMFKQHGPALQFFAPDIYKDITGPGRLVDSGSLLKNGLPGLPVHGKDLPSYEQGLTGYMQALGTKPGEGGQPFGVMQLQQDKADYQMLKSYMLGRIDTDSVVMKSMDKASKVMQELQDLDRLIRAGQSGTIYDSYITLCTQKATKLRQALKEMTPEDMRELSVRIVQLRQAANGFPIGSDMRTELDKRIKSLEQVSNLFKDSGKFDKLIKTCTEGGLTVSTFSNWAKENLPVILATVAATAAVVATMGTAAPVLLGLACAVAGIGAREVALEALYHINKDNNYTGFGNYSNNGSFGGHWWRELEKNILDKTDLQVVSELITKVGGHYAKEIARDWFLFLATAGIVNKFCTGATTLESIQNLAKSSVNHRALAYQAERARLIANQQGVAGSFMREYLANFGREFLINLGFTGAQMSAELGIKQAIGPAQFKKAGEWGEFAMSFGVGTALALGQGAKAGLKSKLLESAKMEGSTLKFKLEPGVPESAFIDHMKSLGFDVQQTKAGKWEVRPIGAPADFKPMTMEAQAARGEGKPPVEVEAPGKPFEKPGSVNSDATVSVTPEQTWHQTPEGQKLLQKLHAFTEAFMSKDFSAALALAEGMQFPAGTKFEVRPRDVDAPSAKDINSASPTDRKDMLGQFLEKMSKKGDVIDSPNGLIISVPRPVMEFEINVGGRKEVVKIDLVTGEPVGVLTKVQADAARTSYHQFANKHPEFIARVKAETALIRMEEQLHALQRANGDKVVSPTYAKFIRDMAFDSPDHTNALLGGKDRSPLTREQELIMALYDAGWPVSQIEHHFGGHHSAARRPVLEYIKAMEAVKSLPTSERAAMQKLLESSPPALRKQMLEHMPEFVEQLKTGGNTVEKIEQFKQAAELADSFGKRLTPEEFAKLSATVKNAYDAIDGLTDPETKGLAKDYVNSLPPGVKLHVLTHLPEFIQRHNGPKLLDNLEQLGTAAETIVNSGKNAQHADGIPQLARDLSDVRAKFPGIANDPALGAITDNVVASAVMKEPALGKNANVYMKELFAALGHYTLPNPSRTKQALEQRIASILQTNNSPESIQLQNLLAIAKRFGLSKETTHALENYDPKGKPPKTEILNREIADAFVERDPGRRTKSFDEFWKKLGGDEAHGLSGFFKKPDDVYNHFGKGGYGKRGAELVKGSDNLYVIDVGGNNYRVLVKFDFATGTASIRWVGTHAQYDLIKNKLDYN